jgi:hypothetical protein
LTGHPKSLAQKLGIERGQTVAILDPPDGYDRVLGVLPAETRVTHVLREGLDLIQFFARDAATLDAEFQRLRSSTTPDGAIWISWPKASSRVPSDLSDTVVRAIGLKHGLVDVKVCAVDETWSGLKFVRRLNDERSGRARIHRSPTMVLNRGKSSR